MQSLSVRGPGDTHHSPTLQWSTVHSFTERVVLYGVVCNDLQKLLTGKPKNVERQRTPCKSSSRSGRVGGGGWRGVGVGGDDGGGGEEGGRDLSPVGCLQMKNGDCLQGEEMGKGV